VGNDCGRALVACAVEHVRPLVRAQLRWVRTCGKGRGWVGPSADSSSSRRCGRERMGMGADGWDQARAGDMDAWN
jgi:hypothetical protein